MAKEKNGIAFVLLGTLMHLIDALLIARYYVHLVESLPECGVTPTDDPAPIPGPMTAPAYDPPPEDGKGERNFLNMMYRILNQLSITGLSIPQGTIGDGVCSG